MLEPLETNKDKDKDKKPLNLKVKELREIEIKYNVVIKELRAFRLQIGKFEYRLNLLENKSAPPSVSEPPPEDAEAKKRKEIKSVLGISIRSYTKIRHKELEDAWIIHGDKTDISLLADKILENEEFQSQKKRGNFKKIDKYSIIRSLIEDKQKLIKNL